jgi:transcriptional regulator with XRE-family HTH domain
MKARKADREQARTLRERGMSLREIASAVGASPSSISVWTRDIAPAAILLERIGAERLAGRRLPVASLASLRRCGSCALVLPACAFGRGQYRCRRCCRDYLRERGDLHRAQSGAARLARRQRAKAHVLAHLLAHPCVDCGEADPVVLEFDHLSGKSRDLSKLAHDGATPERLDAEIELCEVVCVCCHRRRTAARRGPPRFPRPARQRNAEYLRAILDGACCVDCGVTGSTVLDFDHVGHKTADVADLAVNEASLDRLRREVAQCVIRCANCHRRRTSEVGQHFRSRHP